MGSLVCHVLIVFFQAEDGIRDLVRSRGLGDVYKRQPWPAGATTPGNLSVKHRRHHQLKTFGLWATQQDPDTATITWTTLAGRTYVTHAHDYLDGHRGTALSDVHLSLIHI